MKKCVLGIHAAVAVLLGAASVSSFAGIAQGLSANMAAQAVSGDTALLSTGSIAYSTSVPLPVGNLYVKVTLGNGATFVQAAAGSINAAQLVAANQGAATVTVANGVVSADQKSVTFPVAVTGQSAQVATTFTFKGGASNVAGQVTTAGFLSTVGSTLPVTMSIGSSASIAADVDSASTSNVITSVNGLTFAALSSGAATFVTGMAGGAVEAKQIEVTTGSGTALTVGATTNTAASTTLINFGGYKFSDVSGAVGTDAATPFNFATNYTGAGSTLGAVVTGDFSAAQGTGGSVFLSVSNACATTLGTAATVTATAATFPASVTLVPAASGTSTFVCMQVNTPGNTVLIKQTQPTAVITLKGNTATAPATIATPSAALYSLLNNGGTQLVKTYIPAGQAGYTSFIRVLNTGSVSAQISAAVINDLTGVAGPTKQISTVAIAPGGAKTFTSAEIEAGVGAIANSASRPTLSISAPTAIKVQSFILTNANGNFAEVSANE